MPGDRLEEMAKALWPFRALTYVGLPAALICVYANPSISWPETIGIIVTALMVCIYDWRFAFRTNMAHESLGDRERNRD